MKKGWDLGGSPCSEIEGFAFQTRKKQLYILFRVYSILGINLFRKDFRGVFASTKPCTRIGGGQGIGGEGITVADPLRSLPSAPSLQSSRASSWSCFPLLIRFRQESSLTNFSSQVRIRFKIASKPSIIAGTFHELPLCPGIQQATFGVSLLCHAAG